MRMNALDKNVPVPTLSTALFTRFRSRQKESLSEKMLADFRNTFGGYGVKRSFTLNDRGHYVYRRYQPSK